MKTKRTRSSFRSMNSERRLESIFLFVTGKCNAKCAMCFYANDMAKKEKDLTFEEIRKISETAGEINKIISHRFLIGIDMACKSLAD